MATCTKCQSRDTVKCGKKNKKQRYLCKACRYRFILATEVVIEPKAQTSTSTTCTKCQSKNTVKTGIQNHRQRYQCKACHAKFTGPDQSATTEAEQAQNTITCTRCNSKHTIKFGVSNNQQRYQCQTCHHKFVTPDAETIVKPVTTPNPPTCKRCKTGLTIKFGIIRKTQRYYCKKCDYEFIIVKGQEQEVKKKKRPLLQKIRKTMGELSYHVMDKGIDMAADWFLNWLTGGSTYTLGKSLIRKKHILQIILNKMHDFATRPKHDKDKLK